MRVLSALRQRWTTAMLSTMVIFCQELCWLVVAPLHVFRNVGTLACSSLLGVLAARLKGDCLQVVRGSALLINLQLISACVRHIHLDMQIKIPFKGRGERCGFDFQLIANFLERFHKNGSSFRLANCLRTQTKVNVRLPLCMARTISLTAASRPVPLSAFYRPFSGFTPPVRN